MSNNKNNAHRAENGFKILLGVVAYSLIVSLLQILMGPTSVAWTQSTVVLLLLGAAQFAGLFMTLPWSKAVGAGRPLTIALFALAASVVGRPFVAPDTPSMARQIVGIAGIVLFFSFLIWLHKLYQKLERDDLLKSESILAWGLLLGFVGAAAAPGFKGLIVGLGVLALIAYFAYAFNQLRKEAAKSDS